MTKYVGTLTEPGILTTSEVKRHENHKIMISITNLTERVLIKIEEKINPSSNYVNLDEFNRTFLFTSNGDESFLLTNQRIDNLQLNFISGSATIKIYYIGW